ncbi:hypothetical protein MRX96_035537 [Rhipicephalus microplus]
MEYRVDGTDIDATELGNGEWETVLRLRNKYRPATADNCLQRPASLIGQLEISGSDGRRTVGESQDGTPTPSRPSPPPAPPRHLRRAPLPQLPRGDFKVFVRPRGGLDVTKQTPRTLLTAISSTTAVSLQEALAQDQLRLHPTNNTFTLSTPVEARARAYAELTSISLGASRTDVTAYLAPPDDAVRSQEKKQPAPQKPSRNASRSASRDRSLKPKQDLAWADRAQKSPPAPVQQTPNHNNDVQSRFLCFNFARLQYQGICPGVARTAEDFDPPSKFHISGSVPYIRYFTAAVMQFQFYKALCEEAGHNATHAWSIRPSSDVLSLGKFRPWPEALCMLTKGRTSEMDAGPMLVYFQPLYEWLEQQNKGRTVGWTSHHSTSCPCAAGTS